MLFFFPRHGARTLQKICRRVQACLLSPDMKDAGGDPAVIGCCLVNVKFKNKKNFKNHTRNCWPSWKMKLLHAGLNCYCCQLPSHYLLGIKGNHPLMIRRKFKLFEN